jgi:hypothetical protein
MLLDQTPRPAHAPHTTRTRSRLETFENEPNKRPRVTIASTSACVETAGKRRPATTQNGRRSRPPKIEIHARVTERQTREPAASRPSSVSSRRQPSPAPAGTLIIFRTPPPTMSKDVREFIRPLEGAGLTVVSPGVFVKVELPVIGHAGGSRTVHSVLMEALLL